MDITREQLIARIATLPLDLQEMIAAPETLETLETIGKKYDLDVVHIGLLHRLTVRLMAGVIAPQEFVNLIESDLGIERDKVMLIAQEINRDLFNKVKDSLKKSHGIGDAQHTVIEKPTSTVAATPVSSPVASINREVVAPAPKKVITPSTELPTTPQVVQQMSTESASVLPPLPPIAPNPPATPKMSPTPTPKATEENLPVSIFEAKLGGTFAIKNDGAVSTPVVPAIQSIASTTIPPIPTGAPLAPATPAKAVDPYREAVI